MICARLSSVNDIIGASCEECGHTNVVHPGPHNPSLRECLLCRIQHQIAEVAAVPKYVYRDEDVEDSDG